MALNLEQLRTFIVFAESKNVFVAAEKLHISQPAITVHLKAIESQLGRPLFQLKGKKKVLNPFGKTLYASLAPKLKDLEKSTEDVSKQFLDLKDVEIHIAGRREILALLTERLIFPGRVSFHSMGREEALRKLADREVDLAISQTVPDLPGLYSKKLFSDEVNLLVHKDFLKASGSLSSGSRAAHTSDEAILKSEEFYRATPFLSYKNPAPYIEEWMKHLKLPTSLLTSKVTIDDWNSIVQLVEKKMGFALVPSQYASSSTKILSFPIGEKIIGKTDFYALYYVEVKKLFPIERIFSA